MNFHLPQILYNRLSLALVNRKKMPSVSCKVFPKLYLSGCLVDSVSIHAAGFILLYHVVCF